MRFMILIGVLACNTTKPDTTPTSDTNYCNNSGECGDGFLCVDNHCLESECISSSDCSLEEYCTEFFQCVPGCAQDTDCVAGDTCVDNTCTPQGCRETELDCAVGEYCNNNTKSCEEDSFDNCGVCNFSMWQGGISGGECVVYSYDEFSSCSWDDWTQTGSGCSSSETCLPKYLLDPFSSSGGFCASIFKFKNCSPNVADSCSRGFTCLADIYGDGSNTNVCIGDCEYYLDNGYLP